MNGSRDVVGRVAILMWHIWVAYNEVVWNDNRQSYVNIGMNALSSWQQWHEVQCQQ